MLTNQCGPSETAHTGSSGCKEKASKSYDVLLMKGETKMSSKPQKRFNVRFQVVQGKNLLVQRNNAYEIDEVGFSIWELCDGSRTVGEIAEALTQEYKVEYAVALADSQEFIDDLKTKGLLED
jgi:hypothetical protein